MVQCQAQRIHGAHCAFVQRKVQARASRTVTVPSPSAARIVRSGSAASRGQYRADVFAVDLAVAVDVAYQGRVDGVWNQLIFLV